MDKPFSHPQALKIEFVWEQFCTARLHLDHALTLIEIDAIGPQLDCALRDFGAHVSAGLVTYRDFLQSGGRNHERAR